MLKQIAYMASILGLVALGACSSSESSGDAAEGDQAVSTVHPGQEGGLCGGIAGIQCQAGLECKYTSPPPGVVGIIAPAPEGEPVVSGVPTHPDQSGTCVKVTPRPGELGGLCGGIAGIQCKPGLHCQYGGSSGPPPGAVGIVAPQGEPSGFPPGAVGMPIHPDASGKCVSNGPPPGTLGMPLPASGS
jgi:hypothetical protein